MLGYDRGDYPVGVTRNAIIIFGRMISGIEVLQPTKNSTYETLEVPVSFAPKEKWFVRQKEEHGLSDPGATGRASVQTIIPRIGYNMTSISYDDTIPQNRLQKVVDRTNRKSRKTGIPYKLEFDVWIFTKRYEQALEIMEQLIPHFRPSLPVAVRPLGQNEHVDYYNITLAGISPNIEYDSDYESRRLVYIELQFSMNVWYYPPNVDVTQITSIEISFNTGKETERMTLSTEDLYIEGEDPIIDVNIEYYVRDALQQKIKSGESTIDISD